MRGHIDGVICSGPVPIDYPFYGSVVRNGKKFNEFVRKGVADANPVYAAGIVVPSLYGFNRKCLVYGNE